MNFQLLHGCHSILLCITLIKHYRPVLGKLNNTWSALVTINMAKKVEQIIIIIMLNTGTCMQNSNEPFIL